MRGRGEGESGEKYGELDVGDSGLVSSPFSHGARAKSTLRAHGRARTRARPYCSARIEMLMTCSSKIVYSVPIYIHNVNKSRVASNYHDHARSSTSTLPVTSPTAIRPTVSSNAVDDIIYFFHKISEMLQRRV